MYILINIFFLSVTIYNLIKRKQNLFKALVPKSSIIVAIIFLIIGLIIWFLKDKSIIGLITVINAVIFFISFFSAIGINEKYFNCFMANSIVILSVPYDQVVKIIISKKNNKIYLKIKAFSYEFLQQYNVRLAPQLVKFLKKNLESDVLFGSILNSVDE
ncbi:MAG: hypothetical protein Q4E02_02560 [Lagierella massiliensis]|nr:hypothetical protein [Lagierella massiliensis]